jgi:hypothetical protein
MFFSMMMSIATACLNKKQSTFNSFSKFYCKFTCLKSHRYILQVFIAFVVIIIILLLIIISIVYDPLTRIIIFLCFSSHLISSFCILLNIEIETHIFLSNLMSITDWLPQNLWISTTTNVKYSIWRRVDAWKCCFRCTQSFTGEITWIYYNK